MSNTKKFELVRNALGFVEVQPRPTTEELQKFYSGKQYYGNEQRRSQYSWGYTAEEFKHKQIPPAETLRYASPDAKSVLEVGVGEGFFLEAFRSRGGYEIKGADFTDDGLLKYSPALQPFVQIGDVFEYLRDIAASGECFDIIACNNVIEHVLDPLEALRQINGLLSAKGVCRIAVPNDGSWLQEEVVRREYAEPLFWVDPPEHLSYFTEPSLRATLEHLDFEVLDILGEFPVDLFLLNGDTNYMKERKLGRNAHFARVAFETTLFERSVDDLIAFRRTCAQIGIGRNIVAYARRKDRR